MSALSTPLSPLIPTVDPTTSMAPSLERADAPAWERWQRRNAVSARRSDRQCKAIAVVAFTVLLGWLAYELVQSPSSDAAPAVSLNSGRF
jgi:hypothetical protein